MSVQDNFYRRVEADKAIFSSNTDISGTQSRLERLFRSDVKHSSFVQVLVYG